MTAIPTEASAISRLLDEWQGHPDKSERIVHVEQVAAQAGMFSDPTHALREGTKNYLQTAGIERLYRHQSRSIDHVMAGRHTVVAAGTASGKSLSYQIPILERAVDDATALCLYPTKALAHDQFRSFHGLGRDVVAAVYDGDTGTSDRQWARRHANTILTNPDMLHVGILPHHGRWANFLARLQTVVVDELHVLRGIFGSHVAQILRRLRRVAAHYGSSPTFVFTSATIGNPAELASRLCGLPVEAVIEDGSPTGMKQYVLWNPELTDPDLGIRESSLGEATAVFADLVAHEIPTIAFARSRKASELIFRRAKQRLGEDHRDRIASYRGGYLADDRRAVEAGLSDGSIIGVAATNALELGIDVGGLDAAVLTTFPGTISSFRQQSGRAGRRRDDSLAVLVGGQDALDQYYMSHPEELFKRPVEAAVINPDNPDLLSAHVGCAAYELPLVPEDRLYIGEGLEEAAPLLVADDALRLRDGKLYWARRGAPAPDVDIRTSGGPTYTIGTMERLGSGTLLGHIDQSRAFSQCHQGAIYLHQGESYVVEHLDLDRHEVLVRKREVGYYTQPKIDKDVAIEGVAATKAVGRATAWHGVVKVTSQVVAFQRKEINGGAVLATEPLDLPVEEFVTQAFWYTFPDDVVADTGLPFHDLPGTVHAAEHTAIAMLPLFAICDRWDVGGLSTVIHPDTGGMVFFIYDGYSGGAGISPIGFDAADAHLAATLAAVSDCPCRAGCPSCVQSPKCGNFNDPLDKEGARRLLDVSL